MNPATDLLALLNYRMNAVAVGHMALRYSMSWAQPPAIQILFDGKQVVEGKATAFTNPAIEAAIVHSRALLEFLGLGLAKDSQTKLAERSDRRPTDYGVEQFIPLQRVSVEKALRSYPGPAIEAEAALAYVVYLANKGLAHTASSFTKHDQGNQLLEIALRGVPVLVVNSFYIPLGLEPPDYLPPSRPRVI
jgi:hypothetical protein